MQVPALQPDGTVLLVSEEMHRSVYEPFLMRGGLLVSTDQPLEPLSELDLQIRCGCLPAPVKIRAQVVTLMPGRAVLQFIDASPALLESLKPPAEAAPPAPILQLTQPAPRPGDSIPGAADLGVGELFEMAPPSLHLDPPVAEAAPRPSVPPILEGDLLRFLSVNDFRATLAELSTGEIAAALSGRMPGKPELSVRLQAAEHLHPTSMRVRVEPRPAGFVWVRFLEADTLRRELGTMVERIGGRRRAVTEAISAVPETQAQLPRVSHLPETPAGSWLGAVEPPSLAPPTPEGAPSPARPPTTPAPIMLGNFIEVPSPAHTGAPPARAPTTSPSIMIGNFVEVATPTRDPVPPTPEFLPPPVRVPTAVANPLVPPNPFRTASPSSSGSASPPSNELPILGGSLHGLEARPATQGPTPVGRAETAAMPIALTPPPLPPAEDEPPPPPMGNLTGDQLRYRSADDFREAPRTATVPPSVGVFANPVPVLGASFSPTLQVGGRSLGPLPVKCIFVAPGYAQLSLTDLGRTAEVERALDRPDPAAEGDPGSARPLSAATLGPQTVTSLRAVGGPGSRPPTTRPGTGSLSPARPLSGGNAEVPTPVVTSAIVSAAPAAWSLPLSAELVLPELAEEYLAQPIARTPLPAQLAKPTAGLLLRWLSSLPGNHKVTFSQGGKEYDFAVGSGLELRSNLAPDGLAQHLAEAHGRYTVARSEPSTQRVAGRTRAMLADVLRRQLRAFDDAKLAAGLSFKASRSPRLNERGRTLVPALGFSQGAQRTAKRLLDGNYRVDEVVYSGAGVRGGWELLYLLDLFDGLEWVDPPERTTDAVNMVEAHWKRMELQDHFEALGLHWSAPPKRIEPAYQVLKKRYAPGSAAYQSSPEFAEKILARVELAFQALRTRDLRAKHRKERYPTIRFDFQLEVIVTQAQFAMMRRELSQARELLEGAQDIGETPEMKVALERLHKLEAGR